MLVLAGVTNRDIGVWESGLSTFVRDKCSATMPPGVGAVIEMFPIPVWKGMTDFVNRQKGVLLPLQPSSPVPAPTPSLTPSGGVDFNKRPAADSLCFMYLQHSYLRCRHDPAYLAAPAAASTGDNRHGSASSGMAKSATGGTGGNRNGLGGQRNGSDSTRIGSTSRVDNAWTRSSSRAIVAWRGSRGGGGGRGGTRGSTAAVVEGVLLASLLWDRD